MLQIGTKALSDCLTYCKTKPSFVAQTVLQSLHSIPIPILRKKILLALYYRLYYTVLHKNLPTANHIPAKDKPTGEV